MFDSFPGIIPAKVTSIVTVKKLCNFNSFIESRTSSSVS